VCLLCVLPAFGTEGQATVELTQIMVNGRKLSGPNTSARKLGGKTMVPAAAIARALGDAINVDRAVGTVTVRQQAGVVTSFNAAAGEVFESGTLRLTVPNTVDLLMTSNIDEIMLPLEAVAVLFGVTVKYNPDQNVIVLNRGGDSDAPVSGGGRSFELIAADYEYNLNRYSSATTHDLVVNAIGRLDDGRFQMAANSGFFNGKAAIRRATFTLERSNAQKIAAGDIGSGAELPFLSTPLRGGSASALFGKTAVTAFAGRSYSGDLITSLSPVHESSSRQTYDTTVLGLIAAGKESTFGSGSLTYAYGGMRFSSLGRKGELGSASFTYDMSRLRLQADAAVGRFNRAVEGERKSRTATAFDIAGTFQAAENLSFQGRVTRIGKHFISPQSGTRDPVDLNAAGVSWSPVRSVTASFNASESKSLLSGDRSRYVSGSVSLMTSGSMPHVFISHTQSSSSRSSSAAFTSLNASKDFARFRLYLNAARIKSMGPASVNAQVGAVVSINDHNSLEIAQGMGSRGSMNGQFDWRSSNLLNKKLSFTAGGGYTRSASSGISTFERVSASISLPRYSQLQVNLYQTKGGPTILVSLKGSAFRKRDPQAYLQSSTAEIRKLGSFEGRVYQDTDLNGRFDAGVDKPQAGVKVRIDGNRYVVSDDNGQYRFESITAGDHRVYLDLLSIRADLTLLDDANADSMLLPGRSQTVDFRLVRTGRVTGRVWLDANENGVFDTGELTLGDVLIQCAGKDTLTDNDGYFVIGDLPPGEHKINIDAGSIPAKTQVASKSIIVRVYPGRSSQDVHLTVVNTPADVKVFTRKAT
jgi:hypothetical protein